MIPAGEVALQEQTFETGGGQESLIRTAAPPTTPPTLQTWVADAVNSLVFWGLVSAGIVIGGFLLIEGGPVVVSAIQDQIQGLSQSLQQTFSGGRR